MNVIIVSSIAAFCCINSACAALSEDETFEELSRTTFASGGALYLGLNSTVLWLAVLAVGALALIAYVFGLTTLLEDANTSYQQRYSNYYDPDLHAANSPVAEAALAYAQAAQAAQHNGVVRTKRALDESKCYFSAN